MGGRVGLGDGRSARVADGVGTEHELLQHRAEAHHVGHNVGVVRVEALAAPLELL